MGRSERNVIGGVLTPCSHDHGGAHPPDSRRDVSCVGPPREDVQTICIVVTQEFLRHQRSVGNDLTVMSSPDRFPGLRPGDSWCVSAERWAQSWRAGAAAPVVLEGTSARALDVVPLDVLLAHAVDVPPHPGALLP